MFKKFASLILISNIFVFNACAEENKDEKIKQLEAELKNLKIKQLVNFNYGHDNWIPQIYDFFAVCVRDL